MNKKIFYLASLLLITPRIILANNFQNLKLNMSIEEIERISNGENKKLNCSPDIQSDFLIKCPFKTKENGLIWLTFYENRLIKGSFIISGPAFLDPKNLNLTSFGNAYLRNLNKAYGASTLSSKNLENNSLIFHFPKFMGVTASFYVHSLYFSFEVENYNEIIVKELNKKKLISKNDNQSISQKLCLPEKEFEDKISVCGLKTGLDIEVFRIKEEFKLMSCNIFKNEVHPVMGIIEDFGYCYIKIKEQNIWVNFRSSIIYSIHISIKGQMLINEQGTFKPSDNMNRIINAINSNLKINNEEITEYNKGKSNNYLFTYWDINENKGISVSFFQNELNLKISEQYGWPYNQISVMAEEFINKGGEFKVIDFKD